MRTPADFAAAVDPLRLRLAGAIRRMVVTVTTKALWQVLGLTLDGVDEVFPAEVFPGVGVYARPPNKSKLEAIVLMVGADASTPVIVATRDEDTRRAVEKALGGFKPDEASIFNTKSIVYVKADGTIEARTIGGAAESLLPSDEMATRFLAALTTAAAACTTAGNAPGAAALAQLKTTLQALVPTWPRATKKLKGE